MFAAEACGASARRPPQPLRNMALLDKCNYFTMESRRGSASSGPGSSLDIRGQALKSSPFCPRSTSKLTQSIIKDHMVSHYKKVYSAKAAVDASLPKSLIHSVKYNDQIRRSRLRRGARPQSAHSLSQTASRASCSSAQSRSSVQYDESPYFCSRNSMVISPRFSTSLHAQDTVHPSCVAASQNHCHHHPRSASELKYRSPGTTPRRKQSSWSLAESGDQNCSKSFQDPVQKTYSGDLLLKHSQHFTQDKPFTPKTLKSDKSSFLSRYRYYRAPRRNPSQDGNNSGVTQEETCQRRTNAKDYKEEFYEASQELSTEQEWSEDELNGTYLSASRQQAQTHKGRDSDFFDSLSRESSRGWRPPTVRSMSATEEELMYLEFISTVTEDILSRGSMSNRVIDWVLKRHIDMNRHHLDEGKMRHLLDILRKDLAKPVAASTSGAELEKEEHSLLDALLPSLESEVSREAKAKDDSDFFPYVSLSKHCDSPDRGDSRLVPTPPCSSVRSSSESKVTTEKKKEDDGEERCSSRALSEYVSNNGGLREEELQELYLGARRSSPPVMDQQEDYASMAKDQGLHHDQEEAAGEEQSREMEDLSRHLSESLHVTNDKQPPHTSASDSDDDF